MFTNSNTRKADTFVEFKSILKNNGGFISAHWDGTSETEERIKKAGRMIDQITLKPGDLLYLPRGQYHDALASKSGSIHIAFGLTYFKPIDLMGVTWEKLILNDFMRVDFNKNSTKENLKNKTY